MYPLSLTDRVGRNLTEDVIQMAQSRLDLHRQMEHISVLEEALKTIKLDARKGAVELMIRRMYSRYKRTGSVSPFLWWVVSSSRLERTFQYTGNGFGDEVRRSWALDDVRELQKAELQLLDDPEMLWIPQAIADHINEHYPHDKWLLVVEYERLQESRKLRMPGGESLRFMRVLNPEWRRPSDR